MDSNLKKLAIFSSSQMCLEKIACPRVDTNLPSSVDNMFKAQFKRRIFHASNQIIRFNAWRIRRLNQLNLTTLIWVDPKQIRQIQLIQTSNLPCAKSNA